MFTNKVLMRWRTMIHKNKGVGARARPLQLVRGSALVRVRVSLAPQAQTID